MPPEGARTGPELLASRIGGLLPRGCAVRVASAGHAVPHPFPEEAAAVSRAVARRRQEFAVGRALARDALTEVGGPRVAIPVGPGREPVWPSGYTGSISHSAGLVGAVAAPTGVVLRVGLDVEELAPLPEDAASLVLHPRERNAAGAAGLPEVALFSAKESVHKALFPGTRVWMDFMDVEIVLEEPGTFRAAPAGEEGDTAPGLAALLGRILMTEELVVTVAFLVAEGEKSGSHCV